MYHWGHWKDSICHTKSPSCPQPLKSPAPLTCSFINGLALTTDPNCLWTTLHVLLVSACPGSCQQAAACTGCTRCLFWKGAHIVIYLWGLEPHWEWSTKLEISMSLLTNALMRISAMYLLGMYKDSVTHQTNYAEFLLKASMQMLSKKLSIFDLLLQVCVNSLWEGCLPRKKCSVSFFFS